MMNIFDVLGLRDERYHNRMLAWLLNPAESHGLGPRFLANFLSLVEIEHDPEEFVQIEAEYTIYAPDNPKKRRPDIYLQTDGYHIFIENKVRRTSIWGENQLDESFYQFYEDTQLKWGQLENWQDTKNYLVERTMEWMTEFTPTLEEQIVDNTFS
ncbi:MAG TPA: PD-(D/E)XK nuclease family protein [Anaerolineae bacterium]|nr:PD-(D/E)XK nuclease family protein [Anaerolineae bacterium]